MNLQEEVVVAVVVVVVVAAAEEVTPIQINQWIMIQEMMPPIHRLQQ
jgi:hypothetical protein